MIIRRFSLLWEDVLWQVLNICSNDLSPHFTTNLRWHFSCLQHEVFQINYHSTSEFITSEYSGIKVRAFLWSPPVHLCPVWPSHCTTGSAGPQVPTGHHQHLHMGPHSSSLSLWWGRHSQGPPHSLAASLSSGPMGRVSDLSWVCGYPLMAWTHHTQHLQFSTCPCTSPHSTVALMQKSQIGIISKASQCHCSFWTPGIDFTFPIVPPWLHTSVGSRLWLRQLAGQLQRRRCQLCLGYASLSVCLMPRPAKSPTSGFHCTLPA